MSIGYGIDFDDDNDEIEYEQMDAATQAVLIYGDSRQCVNVAGKTVYEGMEELASSLGIVRDLRKMNTVSGDSVLSHDAPLEAGRIYVVSERIDSKNF